MVMEIQAILLCVIVQLCSCQEGSLLVYMTIRAEEKVLERSGCAPAGNFPPCMHGTAYHSVQECQRDLFYFSLSA